jgi:3-methyladenine DNA glycosylase AlkD
MTLNEVMKELESLGSEQTRKIYRNHGADIAQFGVSIAHLKKIAKKLKGNHKVGIELLHSQNVDAIYLSQFVVDEKRVSIDDLEAVIECTNYYMLLDNVVATLMARNQDLVKEFLYEYLDSENDRKKQVGYSAYSMILGSYEDDEIDYNHVKSTIEYVRNNIHESENRVRYSMNNFLIAAGAANKDITSLSKEAAKEIGKVKVFMGKTSCKVPDAFSYITKIEDRGTIGKKRKLK